jgi:hypothetical protein
MSSIQKTDLYQKIKKALNITDMSTEDNPYIVECCKIAENYFLDLVAGKVLRQPDVIKSVCLHEKMSYNVGMLKCVECGYETTNY